MSEPAVGRPKYVKVKDSSGNEWLCPLDALKNAKKATQAELNECVELDVVVHTAGLNLTFTPAVISGATAGEKSDLGTSATSWSMASATLPDTRRRPGIASRCPWSAESVSSRSGRTRWFSASPCVAVSIRCAERPSPASV